MGMNPHLPSNDGRPLIVLGCGGHGRVIVQVSHAAGRTVIGFIDDDMALAGSNVGGLAVLGTSKDAPRLASEHGAHLLVGIGDNRQRAVRVKEFLTAGLNVAVAIDPSAVIAPDEEIAHGTVVMPGVIINTGCR
mgnify:CR=1 FL=1